MAEAEFRLDFCKQALGEIGTRSTITSLDPPDGSPESYYCNLFYDSTRDQLLRAAHWSFAGRAERPALWKAAPGTPENPDISTGGWSVRDPTPPWLYSYAHKNVAILQIRRVRGQDIVNGAADAVPLFGGFTPGSPAMSPCVAFEVAVDGADPNGTPLAQTQTAINVEGVTTGSGYRAGDFIYLEAPAAAVMGAPVTLEVLKVNETGGVVLTGMTDGGSFASVPLSLTQYDTTGDGTGYTCTATYALRFGWQKVILTNAQNILIEYTTSNVPTEMFDPSFSDAFSLALQGKLALALIGDKQLATGKLQQANAAIIEARVRDGNEGLLVYDHVPDWLQVRGISSMTPTVPFNPPYGPLFGV